MENNKNQATTLFNNQIEYKYSCYSLFGFFGKFRQFWSNHPLLTYSLKRILYSLIILIIGLVLIYILFRLVVNVDELTRLPDEIRSTYMKNLKNNPNRDAIIAEIARKYQEKYMKAAGYLSLDLSGLVPEIFNFLYRICPIIPKKISYDVFDRRIGNMVTKSFTSFFYFGTVSAKLLVTDYGIAVGSDVLSATLSTMWQSFITGVAGVILAYIIGVPLGIEISRRKGGITDTTLNVIFAFIYAIPTIAIIAIVKIFFPPIPASKIDMTPLIFIMVTTAIIFIYLPSIVLTTRRYIADEALNDNIKFAKSNGLSNRRLYYVHVFRVSGVKILRSFPSQIIYALIGVSFMTESVFLIKGFASLSLSASTPGGEFDINVLLCTTTISAILVVVGWLLSDIISTIFDPRIAFHKK